MSRYVGKRVNYQCGFCNKQFTLNKKSFDDSQRSGELFCSKQCYEQFYSYAGGLAHDIKHRIASHEGRKRKSEN